MKLRSLVIITIFALLVAAGTITVIKQDLAYHFSGGSHYDPIK